MLGVLFFKINKLNVCVAGINEKMKFSSLHHLQDLLKVINNGFYSLNYYL